MIKKLTKPFVYCSTALIVIMLGLIVGYIVFNGLMHLKVSLFHLHYTSANSSMIPAIISTIIIIICSIGLTLPIGVATSIYMCIYAKKNSLLVKMVTLAAETLAGIPSIIYGLFGYVFFVIKLHFSYSVLACIFTASIMILPLIIKVTEEAIRSMDKKFEYGSYSLGAGKFHTIRYIIVPNILDAILAAVILSVGRIVGETAAFLYTLGTVPKIPKSLFHSSRTLAIHMWSLSQEGLKLNETFATAIVLLCIVLLINYLSYRLTRRISVQYG